MTNSYIISFKDILDHQRVNKLAATLSKRGDTVTLFGLTDGQTKTDHKPGIGTFVLLSRTPLPGMLTPLLRASRAPLAVPTTTQSPRKKPAFITRATSWLTRPLRGDRRLLRAVGIFYFSIRVLIRNLRAPTGAVWIAHDIYALPVTALMARITKGSLIYDAVELVLHRVRHTPPGWLSRKIILWAEGLAKQADLVIAGCPYIARDLENRYGIKALLVLNGQEYTNRSASDYLRNQAGADKGEKLVVYVGNLNEHRGLEALAASAPFLAKGIKIVLIGPAGDAYKRQLMQQIERSGVTDRVVLVPPVSPEDISSTIAGADAGISPIGRQSGNGRYILNNRLFLYIAAGLPVLSSDVEGVGGFVTREKIGLTFDERNPEKIAQTINAFMADEKSAKQMSRRAKAAAKTYSWEKQQAVLLDGLNGVCR